MRQVQCVVFDLGGVAFRYLPERRLQAFARVSGRTPPELRRALLDSGYSRTCDAGQLDVEGAHREGVRLLGHRLGFERFRDLWIAAFEPDEAVLDSVRRLRTTTPVAMLTNNSHLVRAGLEARFPAAMSLFRPSLFSADTGLLKPDPRIFRTLLDLLGAPAQSVLYIDDEPTHVDAAAALGMAAWRYHEPAGLQAELRRLELLQ